LPPAVGPIAALDPLDRPRHWYLAISPGTALRTDPMQVDDARAMAGEFPAADAVIYPIDG
jgi:hypothetical protein